MCSGHGSTTQLAKFCHHYAFAFVPSGFALRLNTIATNSSNFDVKVYPNFKFGLHGLFSSIGKLEATCHVLLFSLRNSTLVTDDFFLLSYLACKS